MCITDENNIIEFKGLSLMADLFAGVFSEDGKLRTELALIFMQIGNSGKYSLSDYLDYLEQVEE